jgi:hypothetical protein
MRYSNLRFHSFWYFYLLLGLPCITPTNALSSKDVKTVVIKCADRIIRNLHETLLLTQIHALFRCYTGTEKNGFYGPMNPTKKRVYAFLQVRDVQSARLGMFRAKRG